MSVELLEKTKAVISYLQQYAMLRNKRVSTIDKLSELSPLWINLLPRCEQIQCLYHQDEVETETETDSWLSIRKYDRPDYPEVREELVPWVVDISDDPNEVPRRLEKIVVTKTVKVKEPINPPQDGGGAETNAGTDTEKAKTHWVTKEISEELALEDAPEIPPLWDAFWKSWQVWSEACQIWTKVQSAYESLDEMRRRLADSEETYELVLSLGFLEWIDPKGTQVKRHLIVAQGEFEFSPAAGVIKITPRVDFSQAKLLLDMLDYTEQPRQLSERVAPMLEQIGDAFYQGGEIEPVLKTVANELKASNRVAVDQYKPNHSLSSEPFVSLSPAIVLQKRRGTALQEILTKIKADLPEVGDDYPDGVITPWDNLVGEGTIEEREIEETVDQPQVQLPDTNNRIFFPLPANEAQTRIVESHRRTRGVVVQGPPGTGKSHTIANLICHLLAQGERVLVTAETAKALAVLRDKLPKRLQSLCVAAMGSSQSEQQELEGAVSGILHQFDLWHGDVNRDLREIEELEGRLQGLEGRKLELERHLMEIREAETYRHQLPGGYEGTAAAIAKKLNVQSDQFDWLAMQVPARAVFPIEKQSFNLAIKQLMELESEELALVDIDLGPDTIPTAERFEQFCRDEKVVELDARDTQAQADQIKVERVLACSPEIIPDLARELEAIVKSIEEVRRVAKIDLDQIVGDVFTGTDAVWRSLIDDGRTELKAIRELLETYDRVEISVPEGRNLKQIENDAAKLKSHLASGGKKRSLFSKPRIVKETDYVMRECLVDGAICQDVDALEQLLGRMELDRRMHDLWQRWQIYIPVVSEDVKLKLASIEQAISKIEVIFELPTKWSAVIQQAGVNYADIERLDDLKVWAIAVNAALATHRQSARQDVIQHLIAQIEDSDVQALKEIVEAANARDFEKYRASYEILNELKRRKNEISELLKLIQRLDEISPGMSAFILAQRNEMGGATRLSLLTEAWQWRSAKTWLEQLRASDAYDDTSRQLARIVEDIEELVSELASKRAWLAFFQRLDDETRQSLIAWRTAMGKIGKGTGKRAAKFRRQAKKYLRDCLAAVPTWIMPLYRLYDTIIPKRGLFDTVIVDEASQCGLDSLLLTYIAKRIIIVGDPMQVSPMAVGVDEDSLASLSKQHLSVLKFNVEYRPDISLFEHAERALTKIVLREHFRCVPEIIRYSNQLCYVENPLIPLRQYPQDRLEPLKSVLVPDGVRNGDINQIEAERLVEQLQVCLNDPYYEGRTFGVVTLQGRKQSACIEKVMMQRIEPEILDDWCGKSIRVGDPAVFQGDERDVMFISMMIAPNNPGMAMTAIDYKRRFNVAMSRARDQAWLFHSMSLEQLKPNCLRSNLLRYFQNPSENAENAQAMLLENLERVATGPRALGTQPKPFDSWFEVDVALELTRREFRVIPQLKVGEYRIDLVVEDEDARIAVECDGDHWHGPEQFDRDMIRQRQLERAQWQFVRIRESEFYANRDEAMRRVLETCEDYGVRPKRSVLDLPVEVEDSSMEMHAEIEEELVGDAVRNDAFDNVDEVPEENDVIENDELVAPVSVSLDGERMPFSGYQGLKHPDPRQANSAEIRDTILEIVERDGPLSRSSLVQLYVQGIENVKRSGRLVREPINRELGKLIKSERILQEDELDDMNPDTQIIRLANARKVCPRELGERKLEEVPPSELILVIKDLYDEPDLPTDQEFLLLCRKLLGHYDQKRLTSNRKDYIWKVLEWGLAFMQTS